MAKGPNYRVPYRRRRQKKTDYATRRILVTSEYPRFVVRISNKNILVQVTKAEIDGDYILVYTSSKELKDDYGWLSSGKNTPAAYIIGYIAGRKALKAGIGKANLDMGLKKSTKGNKVFAVVKGALDAGLEIPCDSDIIPTPDRIDGNIIAEYAENIEDPLEYERRFSVYLRHGLRPEELSAHFEAVKVCTEEKKIE